MTTTLLEALFAASDSLSEAEFAVHFPGPFLVQTRFPQKPSDFDVSFDTAVGSIQNRNTKDIAMRPVMPGDSQRFSALTPLQTVADLLQYHSIFRIEKSQRNSFLQGVTIGRTNNNDVVIQEPTVSKFHAWIQLPGPARKDYMLYDADSHYGTLLNYTKLDKSGATLTANAKIRFGNATLVFLFGDGLYQWIQAKKALFSR
jgi:hypothetical protein